MKNACRFEGSTVDAIRSFSLKSFRLFLIGMGQTGRASKASPLGPIPPSIKRGYLVINASKFF